MLGYILSLHSNVKVVSVHGAASPLWLLLIIKLLIMNADDDSDHDDKMELCAVV